MAKRINYGEFETVAEAVEKTIVKYWLEHDGLPDRIANAYLAKIAKRFDVSEYKVCDEVDKQFDALWAKMNIL